MTITTDKARWYEDNEGFWIAFRTKDRAAAATIAKEVDTDYEIECDKKKRRRSLDANAYLWVLISKLAVVLETTKEELYKWYIQRMGVFKDYHLTEDEAKSFKVAWSMLGTGWLTEQVDLTPDGERLVIRAYYGSSRYNTKQMSRLIDEVVRDCKTQGIETMTPDELSALLDRWEVK